MTIIRASSLTSYQDCSRLTAANIFKEEIADAGYTLRNVPNNIGAAIGTAVHKCMEYTLTSKMNGVSSFDGVAEEQAILALHTETDKGIQYDKLTLNRNDAEKQVRRKTKVFRSVVAPNIQPVSVEMRMEAEIRPGYTLSGQPDWREDRQGVNVLADLKNGKMSRFNAAQYGAYSLLSATHDFKVDEIVEVHMRTVELAKSEPTPAMIAYSPKQCENIAEDVLSYMIADYETFKQTGDNRAFRPNPASMLCSDRYCPAWGSDLCQSHKGAK